MPVFDLEEQKVVARVVYDGAAGAGKTTNLRQLATLFTVVRRSQLFTPVELNGRTLYFDWLQIAGGLVAGLPLLCQAVTVPGQTALAPRRRHLLRSADAVVFVCDSAPGSLAKTRRSLALLEEERARRAMDVPLVVQANKQDAPGALSAAELLAELGLPSGTPVVTARADDGGGVLETWVLAVRSVANWVHEHSVRDGFGVAVTPAESSDELYADLAEQELAPDWQERLDDDEPGPPRLTAHVSETASAAPPASGSRPASGSTMTSSHPRAEDGSIERATPTARPTGARSRPPEADETGLRSWTPSAAPASSETEDAAQSDADGVAVAGANAPPLPASPAISDGRGAPVEAARSSVAPEPAFVRVTPTGRQVRFGDDAWAPLPSPDVPTGFIWPASRGREVLRVLENEALELRRDLANRHGQADGSGRSDTLVCRAANACLKTSPRRRYGDVETARASLLRAAREKIQLGELFVPETVLVLQPDDDGAFWLWTVTPWLTTLRSRMSTASTSGDESTLAAALSDFARVAVDALVLAARQGVVLDVHPSNYAERDGKLYYLDDDIAGGASCPSIGHALLRRVEEYERWSGATDAYLETIESLITERLTAAEMTRLDLRNALDGVILRSARGLGARERLARRVASVHG